MPSVGYAGGLIPITNDGYDPTTRVRVENGSTAFHSGKVFRTFLEIIKPAVDVWYVDFTTTTPVLLNNITLTLDAGAARYSTLGGVTGYTGTFAATLPIINTNAMLVPTPAASSSTIRYGVAPTVGVVQTVPGVERDILRVRTGGGQGSGSPSSSMGQNLYRGLAIGIHAIKIGPVSGVADTNPVNGVLEIVWSELPDEY